MVLRETIEPRPDPLALALSALVWTLDDPMRAQRLLALTGLDAEDLRARAADPVLLEALLGFLAAYEPDLVACADALDVTPCDLVAARAELASS
jgi:Protein of unknown function (DUF3572)